MCDGCVFSRPAQVLFSQSTNKGGAYMYIWIDAPSRPLGSRRWHAPYQKKKTRIPTPPTYQKLCRSGVK